MLAKSMRPDLPKICLKRYFWSDAGRLNFGQSLAGDLSYIFKISR